MEVQSLQTNSFSPAKINGLNPGKKEFTKGFVMEEMKQSQEMNAKEKIEKMLEDIHQLKEKMDFGITVENVMKYKKMISSFLQFYVENALTTHDITSRSRNGLMERLTIVKKVEEGIDSLDDTMSLLDTKSGHLEILKRIDEINGLVINLRY